MNDVPCDVSPKSTVRDHTAEGNAKWDAELRIAAIAFESEEGMMVTDAAGTILRVNRAFTRLTGYSAEEAVGNTPSLINSARHDADFYRRMWAALIADRHWQGEIWNRRKDGRAVAQWMTISAVCGADGEVTHYVGAFSEITEKKEAEAEIHRLAFYDSLTGLPNRRLLIDRLEKALAVNARNGRMGAVLFLDLDNFKILNDTRGHDAGDQLLIEAAQSLLAAIRESDTIARIGGDEFVVILDDLGSEREAAALQARIVGEKVRATLARSFDRVSADFHLSVSVGICLFGQAQMSVLDLLKYADMALYKAKDSGRNTVRFFDPTMQAALDERVAIEADLRQALVRDQLMLYYQPQLDECRRVVGAEALLRWHHPERGMVRPDDFIPVAEQSGLILIIGRWVMETACRQLKRWSLDSDRCEIRLSINVSVAQFRQAGFVAEVREILTKTGADPRRLKIEITESVMVEDVDSTIEKILALKEIGIGFSMDDFGTGYSSLSYLMKLPLDQLKIDRSFVINLMKNPRDAIVTQTIINMAENLRLTVVAEGVETEAQLDFLLKHGCRAFQGYLFSRPLPLKDFEAFLSRAADALVWKQVG